MYPNIGAPGCTLTSGEKLTTASLCELPAKEKVATHAARLQGLNPRPYCLLYHTYPYTMPSLTSQLPVSVVSKPIPKKKQNEIE
jgi:hypothetical protein